MLLRLQACLMPAVHGALQHACRQQCVRPSRGASTFWGFICTVQCWRHGNIHTHAAVLRAPSQEHDTPYYGVTGSWATPEISWPTTWMFANMLADQSAHMRTGGLMYRPTCGRTSFGANSTRRVPTRLAGMLPAHPATGNVTWSLSSSRPQTADEQPSGNF
jgi:hypothetical protein